MVDYREIGFNERDLEEVERKIRNEYNADDLVDRLTRAEIAAMWNAIEGEYDYSWLPDDPAEDILFYYIRETLARNIQSNECELCNQSLRHYFDYWYTKRRDFT